MRKKANGVGPSCVLDIAAPNSYKSTHELRSLHGLRTWHLFFSTIAHICHMCAYVHASHFFLPSMGFKQCLLLLWPNSVGHCYPYNHMPSNICNKLQGLRVIHHGMWQMMFLTMILPGGGAVRERWNARTYRVCSSARNGVRGRAQD